MGPKVLYNIKLKNFRNNNKFWVEKKPQTLTYKGKMKKILDKTADFIVGACAGVLASAIKECIDYGWYVYTNRNREEVINEK